MFLGFTCVHMRADQMQDPELYDAYQKLCKASDLPEKQYYDPSELDLERWYDQTNPKTYLLSYPRSGNTWLRYCIEFLTKRPTLEKQAEVIGRYNCPLGFWLDLGTDFERQPIWKMHERFWMERSGTFDPQRETLILLVRNYKEAITRQLGRPLQLHLLQRYTGRWDDPHLYFDNLALYHRWHPEKRLLLYYEDLITDPRNTLEQLLRFLHVEPTCLDAFFEHFDLHKRCSLHIYTTQDPSITKGNKTMYHSYSIDKQERKAIDAYVANTYPIIWDMYLRRYAEQDD